MANASSMVLYEGCEDKEGRKDGVGMGVVLLMKRLWGWDRVMDELAFCTLSALIFLEVYEGEVRKVGRLKERGSYYLLFLSYILRG